MVEKAGRKENIAGILFFVVTLAMLFIGGFSEKMYLFGFSFIGYGLFAISNEKIWLPTKFGGPKLYLSNPKEARLFGIVFTITGIAISIFFYFIGGI